MRLSLTVTHGPGWRHGRNPQITLAVLRRPALLRLDRSTLRGKYEALVLEGNHPNLDVVESMDEYVRAGVQAAAMPWPSFQHLPVQFLQEMLHRERVRMRLSLNLPVQFLSEMVHRANLAVHFPLEIVHRLYRSLPVQFLNLPVQFLQEILHRLYLL